MKKVVLPFFAEGTKPLDGCDPKVYSLKVPFHPLSFLRINNANTVPEEEKKFLSKYPPPTYMDEALLHCKLLDKKEEIFKASSLELDKDGGGMRMVDTELITKQRGLFTEMIAKIGKSFFNSNIQGLSLPIRIMEPRTDLERMAELYRILSYYYTKAANHPDKLERLKLVQTASIAACYLMLRKQKSINPILGETFQATLADGTEIACEQISHHPPISYVYAVGPSKCYTSYGYFEYVPNFKGTYILIQTKSKSFVRFKDGHNIVTTSRPDVKITGLLMGERRAILKGMVNTEDKTLKLRAISFFDFGEKKGLISSEKTVPKHWVEGIIYVPTGAHFNSEAKRITDLDDVKKEMCRLKGSWLEKVEINSVNYWDIDKIAPIKMAFSNTPIPSDSRFREDLVWLRKGDVDSADGWKDALEIRQRRDLKLREACQKK